MFFAKLNLTPQQEVDFGNMCNKAWNETDKINETTRLIRNYKGKSTVNRGTIERYLIKYASGYDETIRNTIFLKPEYELHNESEMFDDRERIWHEKELHELMSTNDKAEEELEWCASVVR